MCKPVLPIVQDAVAHVLWKAEHLATVHHHHGDHHAEHEIATAAHEEEGNQFPSTSKPAEPVSIHIALLSFYPLPPLEIQKQMFGTGVYTISSLSLDKLYPPPKTC